MRLPKRVVEKEYRNLISYPLGTAPEGRFFLSPVRASVRTGQFFPYSVREFVRLDYTFCDYFFSNNNFSNKVIFSCSFSNNFSQSSTIFSTGL